MEEGEEGEGVEREGGQGEGAESLLSVCSGQVETCVWCVRCVRGRGSPQSLSQAGSLRSGCFTLRTTSR